MLLLTTYCYILPGGGINVLHLVIKDFYVNRKYFLLLLLVAGFIFFADKVSGAIIPIIMISYGMLSRSCYNDDKDRGDVFLRTLPIKPSHIVFSKYIFGLGVVVIAFLPYVFMVLTGKLNLKSNADSFSLVIPLLSICFMYAVYLPVFFRYGYVKARTFQTVLYVGLVLASVGLSSLIESVKISIPISQGQSLLKPLNHMAKLVIENDVILLVYAILISCLLLMASVMVSLRLYSAEGS